MVPCAGPAASLRGDRADLRSWRPNAGAPHPAPARLGFPSGREIRWFRSLGLRRWSTRCVHAVETCALRSILTPSTIPGHLPTQKQSCTVGF